MVGRKFAASLFGYRREVRFEPGLFAPVRRVRYVSATEEAVPPE